MSDDEGKCGLVNVVLERSRDAVKVRDNLMNEGDLLLGYFRCRVEENLAEIISCLFNELDKIRTSRRGERSARSCHSSKESLKCAKRTPRPGLLCSALMTSILSAGASWSVR